MASAKVRVGRHAWHEHPTCFDRMSVDPVRKMNHLALHVKGDTRVRSVGSIEEIIERLGTRKLARYGSRGYVNWSCRGDVQTLWRRQDTAEGRVIGIARVRESV